MNYLSIYFLWKKWESLQSMLVLFQGFLWISVGGILFHQLICRISKHQQFPLYLRIRGEGVWEAFFSKKTWTCPRPWISCLWRKSFHNSILGVPGVCSRVLMESLGSVEFLFGSMCQWNTPSDARGRVHLNRWIRFLVFFIVNTVDGKKSCTSWYDKHPIIHKVSNMPGAAGFLPSTVSTQVFCTCSRFAKAFIYSQI